MPVAEVASSRGRSRRAPVVIGAVILAVGAWSGLSALRFVAASVPATGVVVARGDTTYTVRFEADGRPVQFQSAMPTARGFARSRIRVGETVPVRFPPGAPAEARVAGSALWFFPLAMTLIGVAGVASGLVRPRG